MSARNLKRVYPGNRRERRPPHPSPSPSTANCRRGGSRQAPRRLSKPSRPLEILKRCYSDPALWRVGGGGDGDGDHRRSFTPAEEAEGVLFRPQTCADIFTTSSDYSMLLSRSPRKSLEGYNKDAKVVLNVTVEGSPGPVRTMVKLGSSVEETIKLVIGKYTEERRTPPLDKDATSTFELHNSYFSLQSLNMSDAIGDACSRSFYLRKSSSIRSSNASLNSDNASDKAGTNSPTCHLLALLQNFIVRKINKIIRRTHKLWNILGCINSNG